MNHEPVFHLHPIPLLTKLPVHPPGKAIAPFQDCHKIMSVPVGLHIAATQHWGAGTIVKLPVLGKTKEKFHRMWEPLAQECVWRVCALSSCILVG